MLRDGRAERYVRGRNTLESPYRFQLEVDPDTWFLEDEGYELAVFHSHPETAPRPSRTDLENVGLWAGKPYVIYSLARDELAAWTLQQRLGRAARARRITATAPRAGRSALPCLDRRACTGSCRPAREHVDGLRVDDRHPWRLVDRALVDALPEPARGVGVRGLLGKRAPDLPIDLWVAELRRVRVPRVVGEERRAGEDGDEEAGSRGIVRDPFGGADLRLGARVTDDAEVGGCGREFTETRYPSDRSSFAANGPEAGKVRPRIDLTFMPRVPERATRARAFARSGAAYLVSRLPLCRGSTAGSPGSAEAESDRSHARLRTRRTPRRPPRDRPRSSGPGERRGGRRARGEC